MERSPRSTKNQGPMKTGNTKSSKTSMSSMDNQSLLKKFFIDELQDIYWAEKHLAKELPKLQKAATSDQLADVIGDHQVATEEHINRLEEAFRIMGETAKAKKCEAMEGLIKEAHTIVDDTDQATATRDVGLIMAIQKMEHYEIATYGSLVQLAKTVGQHEVANLLHQTLEDEKDVDGMLTNLAENNINEQGSKEEGHEGEE